VRVEQLGPEEAQRILAALRNEQCRELVALGVRIKGFIDAVCRNDDGSVGWEVHQPNLITDLGRRLWSFQWFGSTAQIFICGVAETPLASRCALIDSNLSTAYATGATPTNDSNTNTKSWSFTFATPGSNRTVAAIGVAYPTPAANFGAINIMAYSLLTPPKTQSTSQTLELSYRLTMTPVA
jgi:hypothetical protein